MREIGIDIKYRAAELFLGGYPYDNIAKQLSVSKGSIVTIIDDFREGRLVLPDHMTACVDELRKLAVDMKKNQVSVTDLKSYVCWQPAKWDTF